MKLVKLPSRSLLLLFILGAFAAIDHAALNPRAEANLSGAWDACPENEDGAACQWHTTTAPKHYKPPDEITTWNQWVTFRKEFGTPPECRRQTCSFVVGEVGDTASVYLNDVLLYPISDTGSCYTKNIALNVPLPPGLLSQSTNELKVRAHSVKIEQSGLAHGPVAITTGFSGAIYAHWKTFRTIFLPLICATIASATALLVSSLTVAVRKSHDVDAFIRYATVSALFMLSFSEIPRMLLPVSIAIPAHFFLRFSADWAAFAWLWSFTETPQWIQRWGSRAYALGAGAVMFVCGLGVLAAAGFHVGDPASLVYQVVLGFYGPLLGLPLLAAIHHARHRAWGRAALVGGVVLVTAHEGLVGFGYLDHEFLSKYHHAVIVFT